MDVLALGTVTASVQVFLLGLFAAALVAFPIVLGVGVMVLVRRGARAGRAGRGGAGPFGPGHVPGAHGAWPSPAGHGAPSGGWCDPVAGTFGSGGSAGGDAGDAGGGGFGGGGDGGGGGGFTGPSC